MYYLIIFYAQRRAAQLQEHSNECNQTVSATEQSMDCSNNHFSSQPVADIAEEDKIHEPTKGQKGYNFFSKVNNRNSNYYSLLFN